MTRIIAVTLVVALIAPTLPAFAGSTESSSSAATATAAGARPSVQPAVTLRESAKQAVGASVQTTATAENAAYGPRSLPRTNNDGVRNQMGGGGSKTGMIIGLVSAAAGIAATVYMVKTLKKSTDSTPK